ncbi:MAG TPA: hypothetical protein PKI14_01510 [Fervidobacterium sp.]|nr:hypothetical protein [Fervidobacterium sp.]
MRLIEKDLVTKIDIMFGYGSIVLSGGHMLQIGINRKNNTFNAMFTSTNRDGVKSVAKIAHDMTLEELKNFVTDFQDEVTVFDVWEGVQELQKTNKNTAHFGVLGSFMFCK